MMNPRRDSGRGSLCPLTLPGPWPVLWISESGLPKCISRLLDAEAAVCAHYGLRGSTPGPSVLSVEPGATGGADRAWENAGGAPGRMLARALNQG